MIGVGSHEEHSQPRRIPAVEHDRRIVLSPLAYLAVPPLPFGGRQLQRHAQRPALNLVPVLRRVAHRRGQRITYLSFLAVADARNEILCLPNVDLVVQAADEGVGAPVPRVWADLRCGWMRA